MLRTLFVLIIATFGFASSLRGPFYALLFYLWIAYFRPESWVWGGLVTELPLSMFAGTWALTLAIISGQGLRVDGRLAILLLFLAHGLISTTLSSYPTWAWSYWLAFLKITVMTYLLAVLVTDVRRLRLALLVITLSLGFEATKQGWAQLLLNTGSKNFNAIPFLGDENGVAIGMFMLLPLVGALIATESRRWATSGLLFLALGVTYRGISTYSRGGFLTLLSIVGMFILRSRHKLVAVGAACALVAGMTVLMNDAFWDRINSIGIVDMEPGFVDEVSADEASTMGRLHFWRIALDMANDHPVFGIGFNAYNLAYNSYDTTDGAFNRRRSVHSAWLGILSELGYVGLLLFLIILGQSLWSCRRVRRLAKQDEKIAALLPFATAVETSLVGAAVGGTFVIFQYSEILWHMVGLSIALNRQVNTRLAEIRAIERRPVHVPRPVRSRPAAAVASRLSAREDVSW